MSLVGQLQEPFAWLQVGLYICKLNKVAGVLFYIKSTPTCTLCENKSTESFLC